MLFHMVDDEDDPGGQIHHLDIRQAEISLRLQRMYERISSEAQPERLQQLATRLSEALWLRHQNEDGIADEDADRDDAEPSQPWPDVAAFDEGTGVPVEAEPDSGLTGDDDEISDPDPDGGDPPLQV